MSTSVNVAIILLILGNLFASISDVAVKLLDGSVSPYQYIFIRQLCATAVIFPFWLSQERRLKTRPSLFITTIRAHLGLLGSGCMVIAITYLPLATANAIFYAAPLIMLPFSIWLLKETPSTQKVIATLIGFIGVMVVLRPSQFHWAAYFALGTALALALSNILVRRLPASESLTTTLMWTSLLSLPISAIMAYWHWQPLTSQQFLWVLCSSLAILIYNGFVVLAYKQSQAVQIALAEYSGLIFVALFGVMWFDEIPDVLTLIGIICIVLPLMPGSLLKRYVLRRKRN